MDYPGKVITKTQVTPTQTSASGNWTLDDQAAAIKNNNWPVALVPNPISKSLRFNSADSAYLNRTFVGTPNTYTLSMWIKRSTLGTQQMIIGSRAGSSTDGTLQFGADNTITVVLANTYVITTTAVYRDPSAWYHLVLSVTASGTAYLYINNVQVGSVGVGATCWLFNSTNTNTIGRYGSSASTYYDGYMTEMNFIDGQALTPSSFGMTNPQTGQWIPLKYSGTYGTNGFYLNFKDATSTTTLGLDYSGNANNWTTNNFSVTAGVGNDSLTDVPTPWFAYNTTGDVGGVIRGNYATLNPVGSVGNGAYTNGNLDFTANTSSWQSSLSTIGVTSGKWYFEATATSFTSPNYIFVGAANSSFTTYNNYLGVNANAWGVQFGNGSPASIYKYNNGGTLVSAGTISVNDVLQVAIDVDNGRIWFGKNNTWIEGSPSAGTGASYTNLSGTIFFGVSSVGTGEKLSTNFGQRPFAYTPPTGFRSLCTTNLPATAIGFGLTNQGDDYFNTVLYTGNSTARSITGVGFQPDFTWIKMRSGVSNHALFDSVRGATQWLASNLNQAETTDSVSLTSFDSDGFSLGTGANLVAVNNNTSTFVAWNWNAGGSNVTNTNGTRTSTVRANTTAGFSIVTWTANGSSPQTIGHGLGVAPSMIITFLRNLGGDNHYTYHVSLGATKNVRLDETAAAATQTGAWNDTAPTSTVFSTGNFAAFTTNGCSLVAYCFAPVPGYSSFGSYTGNGSTDGPFVYLGFRPRFVMIKVTNTTGSWDMYDAARNTYNVVDKYLNSNNANAEGTFSSMDFLSNGFKLRNTDATENGSGNTIIYAAFAEFPFQFANAR